MTYTFDQLSDQAQQNALKSWLASSHSAYNFQELNDFINQLKYRSGIEVSDINFKQTDCGFFLGRHYQLANTAVINGRTIDMTNFEDWSAVRMGMNLYYQLALQKRLWHVDINDKCLGFVSRITTSLIGDQWFAENRDKAKPFHDKAGRVIAKDHAMIARSGSRFDYIEMANSDTMLVLDEYFDNTAYGKIFLNALKGNIKANPIYSLHAHVQAAIEAVLHEVLDDMQYHQEMEYFANYISYNHCYKQDGVIATEVAD